MKISIIGILLIVAALGSGCASEVDKCVKAHLNWYEKKYPNSSATEIATVEMGSRIDCLKAASNK